ncbi:MAG TPA: hypothetical protein VFC44_20895 [Candidatus Saccharimonadales bacterium]|nr:hypothetical protein [Candidatus Saccharimonadales bacterium]
MAKKIFATRCKESGVDMPPASRCFGHKDGGTLALKVYGHSRNEHSASMATLVNFASADSNIIPLATENGKSSK